MAEEFNGAKVTMAMLVLPISDMVSKAYKGFDILTIRAMLSGQCLPFCLEPTSPTMESAEPQHDCGVGEARLVQTHCQTERPCV